MFNFKKNLGSEYVKLIFTNYIRVQVCCEPCRGDLGQIVNSSLLIVSISKYCASPLKLSFGNCAKLNIIINLNVIIIANPELLIHAVLVFLYHLKYPFVLHLILYIANLQKNIISECDIMKSYDCLDTIITNGGNHLNCGPSCTFLKNLLKPFSLCQYC